MRVGEGECGEFTIFAVVIMKRILAVLPILVALWASGQTLDVPDQGQRALYSTTISTDRATLTGVCMMKNAGDTLLGSIVNEFGIRAFSFSVMPDRNKVKLHEVMPALNKWYIKRTLRDDLRCLFQPERLGKHRELTVEGDTTTLVNRKRNIFYKFIRIPDETNQ